LANKVTKFYFITFSLLGDYGHERIYINTSYLPENTVVIFYEWQEQPGKNQK